MEARPQYSRLDKIMLCLGDLLGERFPIAL